MKLPELNINTDQIQTLAEAKEIIKYLLNIIEQLVEQNRMLLDKVQALEKEISQLKKQSGKPNFKKTSSNQRYLGNPAGTSFNNHHKRRKEVEIDREEDLPEVAQCSCGSERFTVVRTWEKIIQGLILKRDNVRYHGRDKQCRVCGKHFRSQLPTGVSGYQFSPFLRSCLSVFKYECRMSEQIIQRFLTGVGVKISSGQINQILMKNSSKLESGYIHLKVWGLKLSRYVHSDATGFTRQVMKTGKRLRHHLHFVGHQYLSFFKVTSKYNSLQLASKVLGKRVMQQSIYISDDASANGDKLTITHKQLCWIHEIRHYLKLDPQIKLHRQELQTITNRLWAWYEKAKQYDHQGREPTAEERYYLETTFDEITNTKVGYELLQKRLLMTRCKKNRLLCFLNHPGLPIQNNLAERDLRPAVIIRKLSGGTKSTKGDTSFQRHMSIIQTAHKQDLNILDTIHGLLMGTLDPFILTRKTLPALQVY